MCFITSEGAFPSKNVNGKVNGNGVLASESPLHTVSLCFAFESFFLPCRYRPIYYFPELIGIIHWTFISPFISPHFVNKLRMMSCHIELRSTDLESHAVRAHGAHGAQQLRFYRIGHRYAGHVSNSTRAVIMADNITGQRLVLDGTYGICQMI